MDRRHFLGVVPAVLPWSRLLATQGLKEIEFNVEGMT
jgi:hypothetical protein